MSIPESWASLEADMIGDEPDYETEPEPIGAADLDHANRQLARLARVQRVDRANREVAESQIRQVEGWLAGEQAKTSGKAAWLEASIAGWHAAVLSVEPSRKTITLPSGTSTARKAADQWVVDEPVFLAWAVGHAPTIVRQKPAPAPEVDRAAMKKTLVVRDDRDRVVAVGVEPTSGETPPGLVVTAGVVEFKAIPTDEGGN